MPDSDPVLNCSLNLRKESEENLAWTVEDKHPGNRCDLCYMSDQHQGHLRGHPQYFCQSSVLVTTKMNDSLTQHFTGTRQGQYCWKRSKKWTTRFFRKALVSTHSWRRQQDKTRFEYCEDSKNSLACFRAIQGHSVGMSIDPEMMECIRVLSNGYFWTGVVLSAFSLSLRKDWFRVERIATKNGRLSSSPLSTILVEIPTKKTPWWPHSSSKNALPQLSETLPACSILDKISPVPAECIFTEICQNGDRIMFERLYPRQKSHWKAIDTRSSSSSRFVMMCRLVQEDLYGRANLGDGMSQSAQRMIRLVQGNLYGTLIQLLTKSQNSKLIFE